MVGEKKCRCGFDGIGEHPCHAKAYSCKNPAQHRFYNLEPVALAGMMMKMQAQDTWACDGCWEEFKKLLKL